MKYFLFTLLILNLGCGYTTFELKQVNLALVQERLIKGVPCRLYEIVNEITPSSNFGILIDFDIAYSADKGSMARGLGGTKDTITSVKVLFEKGENQIDITNELYNIEPNYEMSYLSLNNGDFRCICFDSKNDRFFVHAYDKRYQNPTIYTYDINENVDIVYWAHGDTSIYNIPPDTSSYTAFFREINSLKESFNLLYVKTIDGLNNGDNKGLTSGLSVQSQDFVFWLPDRFLKQVNQNEFIKIEVELSNGKVLKDKIRIEKADSP